MADQNVQISAEAFRSESLMSRPDNLSGMLNLIVTVDKHKLL